MRLLLIVAVFFAVSMMVRRALESSRNATKRGSQPPRTSRSGRPARGAPQALVCGVCGQPYDPDQTGWTCPKCKQ